MPVFIRVFITVCLCLLVVSPALAQSKKELAAQDMIIMDRLSRLESRMLTGDPAAERLMQRMDSLEENMRTLTGDVERLRFERDNLRAEVAALASEIETLKQLATRMSVHLDAVDMVSQQPQRPSYGQPSSAPVDISNAPAGTVISSRRSSDPYFPSQGTLDPAQPSQVPSAPVIKEQVIGVQQYNDVDALPAQGKQKLAEGDFSGAQMAFNQYLTVYPDAPDAGEVSYWLGESYFVKGGYNDAADAYIASLKKDGSGPMAPSALVSLAVTMRELGNKEEACNALGSLTAQYPNASASVRNKARVESVRTGC